MKKRSKTLQSLTTWKDAGPQLWASKGNEAVRLIRQATGPRLAHARERSTKLQAALSSDKARKAATYVGAAVLVGSAGAGLYYSYLRRRGSGPPR